MKKLTVLLLLAPASLFAQKSVTDQRLVWYGYFLTIQFNDKWYWQTEVQERHFTHPVAQHQFLVRSHVHRAIGNTNWEASAGMCIFYQDPNDPEAEVRLTVPELRPHIEFLYKQKLRPLSLDHRYKVESRFFHDVNEERTALDDGFSFGNFRFRYRLQATVPVLKLDDQRTLKIKASDEILVNVGNNIVANVFDQNRIYAGLSVDLSSHLTFDVGYLNWFQQRPSGDFYNRHILRLTAYHKIAIQKHSNN